MNNAQEIGTYLGLRGDNITTFDLINLARNGIKASFAKKLMADIKITQDEFAESVGLKIRTLARRFEKPSERLTPEESEKVIRLVRVFFESMIVFQDAEKVSKWLKRPNRALGNNEPISYLDSDIGAEEVLSVLGRIKHGVYS